LSIDTNGKQLTTIGEPDYREPRLSPDARFLAFSADEQKNGRFSIGVYDLQRGVATRLTDGGTDRSPAWSKDAKRITYTTLHEIKEVAVDGSGTPETLLKGGVYLGHMDWSTEDQLLFTEMSSGLPSLSIYSPSDQKVRAFAPGAEGRFSPDGKWIAYVGPLTTPGSDAIFVAPFPGQGGRIRVSSASGAQPLWARDGKHLFYIAPDRKLMEVQFDPRTGSAGPPQVLFQTSIVSPNFVDTQYTLSPNGGFFINSFPHIASPLTLQIGSKFGDKH
jgi:Tol biopolymer transport system component